jgi:hypothetical protein
LLSLKQAADLAREHGFTSLITEPSANTKLAKSQGYYNAGISLAQASLSGYNMCFGSTVNCRKACLGFTGRAEYLSTIQETRIARTKLYATNPTNFWAILEPELHKVDRAAKRLGVPVAFRPNILSDQPWHLRFPQMFEIFSHWQFYSYTKILSKARQFIGGLLPPNYHVTFSWSERVNDSTLSFMIDKGVNVAVPFYDKKTLRPTIPTQWRGHRVINGNTSDLRFLDPPGVVVGLSVKLPKCRNKAKKLIAQVGGFFVGV